MLESNFRYIFPVGHFGLSFIWERYVFNFSRDWSLMPTIAMNQTIPDSVEWWIVYFLYKCIAGIIIYLLWKLIFAIRDGKVPEHALRIFGRIYLVGLIIGGAAFPRLFGLETDNYLNYSYVIHFIPTYWHSIYLGGVYGGCLMTIPHPIGIFILQWLSFILVIAYIYIKSDSLVRNNKWLKYSPFVLLVLPESYYIVFNAYRNNMYTILCLFYFSYIVFSVKSDKFSKKEMCTMAVLSAFIMVWRSEGIILGLGGISILILFVYSMSLKWKISLLGILIAAFVAIGSIQNIGTNKYYGNDYMLVNTSTVLYRVLNDPLANLNYDGADNDLDCISRVVPLEVLKEKGLEGYRNYNWTCGRRDFNQTTASNTNRSNYISAYFNIVAHNPVTYVKNQTNQMLDAIGVPLFRLKLPRYLGRDSNGLKTVEYNSWRVGYNDVEGTFFTRVWDRSSFRNAVYFVSAKIWGFYARVATAYIGFIYHIVTFFTVIAIAFVSLRRIMKEREMRSLKYFLLSLIIFVEILGLFATMPEGRPAYLYPVFYISYLVIYTYVLEKKLFA